MLNRLTVSALLQSVIALLAICVVAFLGTTAWQSWERLRSTSHIAAIASASANAFKAMHNLRTDGSSTSRVLNDDYPISPDIEKFLHSIHDAEMPAIRSTATLLPSMTFADCGIRGKAATDSDGRRPAIPIESGHPIRTKGGHPVDRVRRGALSAI